jgi:Domain of unknown function (DUF4136)
MRFYLRSLAALAIILGVSACAPQVKVTSDYDAATNFSSFSSYRWMNGPALGKGPLLEALEHGPAELLKEGPAELLQGGPPPMLGNGGASNEVNSLNKDRIDNAINSTLQSKGFYLSNNDDATFYVKYHIKTGRGIDVNTMNTGFTPLMGFDWNTTINQYETGSLIIDILDPRTRKLVWRGIGEARLEGNPTAQERTKEIDEAVAKIMASFPPEKTK